MCVYLHVCSAINNVLLVIGNLWVFKIVSITSVFFFFRECWNIIQRMSLFIIPLTMFYYLVTCGRLSVLNNLISHNDVLVIKQCLISNR